LQPRHQINSKNKASCLLVRPSSARVAALSPSLKARLGYGLTCPNNNIKDNIKISTVQINHFPQKLVSIITLKGNGISHQSVTAWFHHPTDIYEVEQRLKISGSKFSILMQKKEGGNSIISNKPSPVAY